MEKIDFNVLRDRIYKTACEHGWHEEKHSIEHHLMLIVTELSEAVNAHRIGKHADTKAYNEGIKSSETVAKRYRNDTDIYRQTRPDSIFEKYIKDTVEDELADAVIRMLDFTRTFNYAINIVPLSSSEKDRIKTQLDEAPLFAGHILSFVDLLIRGDFDHFIRCMFYYSSYLGIDLNWHIEQKMKYNELRPYKHGGKKY